MRMCRAGFILYRTHVPAALLSNTASLSLGAPVHDYALVGAHENAQADHKETIIYCPAPGHHADRIMLSTDSCNGTGAAGCELACRCSWRAGKWGSWSETTPTTLPCPLCLLWMGRRAWTFWCMPWGASILAASMTPRACSPPTSCSMVCLLGVLQAKCLHEIRAVLLVTLHACFPKIRTAACPPCARTKQQLECCTDANADMHPQMHSLMLHTHDRIMSAQARH